VTGLRGVRLIVGIALLVGASCLVLFAQAQGDTAAAASRLARYARSSDYAGVTGPSAGGAAVFAALAAILGAGILLSGSRTLFRVIVVASMMFLGAGVWLGLSTDPLIWPTWLHGVVARPVVAVVLVASSAVAGAASFVASVRIPGLPDVARPHMPPQTHLG
jgi:hypothetical protein